MDAPDDIATSNPLARHYRHFRVAERLLLTGHSHQAWPDCARTGHLRAWEDAAARLDEKWERAAAAAEAVRQGFRRLLDDPEGHYALAASTHELLVRFLSALDLRRRPRLITTDSEFHSARRQLARLGEEGIEVVRVAARPAASVGERLGAAVDDRTAAIVVSTVFFDSGEIAGNLEPALRACRHHGAALLLDAYHQLNVVPISLAVGDLLDAYVVGGGYKYCQLGEGNAFLRFPADCRLRPVVTGWFAEFGQLARQGAPGAVPYPDGPDRFAGATYDPTSHYRAAEVFAFFRRQQLSPERLRRISQHQIGLLRERFDALDLDPRLVDRDRTVALEDLGGFLALRSSRAADLCRALRRAGVLADFRGDVLRLGPAPYLADRQLEEAIGRLGTVARETGG